MRPILPVLLLLAPALTAEEPGAPAKRERDGLGNIGKLLPNGSELQSVTLPRYDERKRLVGMLKADCMTLIDEQTVSGNQIAIRFYHTDGSQRGRLDLRKATFHDKKGLLEAREPVTLQSDSIHAVGRGLVYAFERGEGFLIGPLTTWTDTRKHQTTMKSRSSTLRAAGLAGAALASQAVAADTPAGAPDVPPAAVAKETRADLAASLEASIAANAAAKAFLEQADLIDPNPPKAPEPAASQPLDLKPGPDDTVISCDGGMYFNPDQGVFVYFGNVRVNDPRFTMTGANELKIFLEKLPVDATKNEKPGKEGKEDTPGFRDKFGDAERIVATGAILIDQKPEDGKDPIKASGAIFTYNIDEDLVLISGGHPWVQQGSIALRAMQPNLTLRIYPKGSRFETEGHWDTIANFEKIRAEQEKRKQEKKTKDTNSR